MANPMTYGCLSIQQSYRIELATADSDVSFTYLSDISSNDSNLGEEVQRIVYPTREKHAAGLGQI